MAFSEETDVASLADWLSFINERIPAKPVVSPTYPDRDSAGHAANRLSLELGPRYRNCSFENFTINASKDAAAVARTQAAVATLRSWAMSMDDKLLEGGGVTLYGPPGTGKDHLMAALMYWAILRFGFSVEWVNGLDLYGEMRTAISDDASEMEIIRKYQKPLILVISDPIPPKGEISRYNSETLFRIIDRRYRDMKSTWATMNVAGGDEANDRMARNLIDRLKHNSLCIHCDWDSYRKPKP